MTLSTAALQAYSDSFIGTFDHISSVGVLHHMKVPEDGLRALLKVLRPGALIEWGLYSDTAREDIVAGIKFREERGIQPTLEGIRAFRQTLLELPAGAPARNVKTVKDFFSISGCRDLLFHVQEHRYSLKAVAKLLHRHHLAVTHITVSEAVKAQFRSEFPEASDTDLEAWARFEKSHPRTFLNMYQLIAQKAAG